MGYFETNPIAKLIKRRAEPRIINVDVETIQKLLDAPDQQTFVGLRDYCLILLTLDWGIRPSEALLLVPDDFSPEKALGAIVWRHTVGKQDSGYTHIVSGTFSRWNICVERTHRLVCSTR